MTIDERILKLIFLDLTTMIDVNLKKLLIILIFLFYNNMINFEYKF